ncbi:SAMD4A, partial [Cervus elaphus hippelaphus]
MGRRNPRQYQIPSRNVPSARLGLLGTSGFVSSTQRNTAANPTIMKQGRQNLWFANPGGSNSMPSRTHSSVQRTRSLPVHTSPQNMLMFQQPGRAQPSIPLSPAQNGQMMGREAVTCITSVTTKTPAGSVPPMSDSQIQRERLRIERSVEPECNTLSMAILAVPPSPLREAALAVPPSPCRESHQILTLQVEPAALRILSPCCQSPCHQCKPLSPAEFQLPVTEPDINNRLESLCLSMTEHALG